jgi:undecaprenyl-diphosphatase
VLPNWISAIVFGLIEGLTEFIPVSSTGHLLLAQVWLPRQSDLFNVVIQSGAVLAVLPLFKDRLLQLKDLRSSEGRSLLTLISIAFFATAIGGLVLEKLHFKLPENPKPVALALIIGGVLFFVSERILRSRILSAQCSKPVALLVGVAQLVAAIFPGSSRSGATIIAAMLAGTGRAAATEFSFLVGIPTLLAASGLKILKALKHGAQEDWAMLMLATLVAAAVSFVSVKWLLRFVQSHSFVSFGAYRIVLGAAILWLL